MIQFIAIWQENLVTLTIVFIHESQNIFADVETELFCVTSRNLHEDQEFVLFFQDIDHRRADHDLVAVFKIDISPGMTLAGGSCGAAHDVGHIDE